MLRQGCKNQQKKFYMDDLVAYNIGVLATDNNIGGQDINTHNGDIGNMHTLPG